MKEPLMQWSAIVGAVVVGVFFVFEMLRWHGPNPVLSRPMQRKLRVAEVILIEIVFAMICFGPNVVGSRTNPFAELLYWVICVFIGLAVVLVAMFDLLSITKGYKRYSRRMYGDIFKDQDKK